MELAVEISIGLEGRSVNGGGGRGRVEEEDEKDGGSNPLSILGSMMIRAFIDSRCDRDCGLINLGATLLFFVEREETAVKNEEVMSIMLSSIAGGGGLEGYADKRDMS